MAAPAPRVVVFDVGTYTTKVGYAGGHIPLSMFPTLVGSNKSSEVMIGGKNRDFFVGYEAAAKASLLNLRSPVENGFVTNWEDMEKLWSHVFYNDLVIAPASNCVLLAEKSTISRQSREKAMQIMFESFNVGSYFSVNQAVCVLLSLGKTTGLVWDAGHGAGFVVPIYEGCTLQHAIGRSRFSGAMLTEWLQKTFPEWKDDTAREMKEQVCRVALDYQTEVQRAEQGKIPAVVRKLKDGSEVSLKTESFRCPEGLFQPALIDGHGEGIHQLINTSLERCDIDVRRELYSSIVLAGGTSMFPGLAERVEREVVALATPQMKVNVISTPERKNAVWLGASILGSLDAFPQMVVSNAAYREEGAGIIHIICSG
jgi:actin-related protein